jgi:hypothetical protein
LAGRAVIVGAALGGAGGAGLRLRDVKFHRNCVRALLGGDTAVTNPMISSFDLAHGLAPLVGKMLAIIGDARIGGRTDQAKIAELFLSLSGEDRLTVNPKNKPAFDMRLRARVMWIANEAPRSTAERGWIGAVVEHGVHMLSGRRQGLPVTDQAINAESHPGSASWSLLDCFSSTCSCAKFSMPAMLSEIVGTLRALLMSTDLLSSFFDLAASMPRSLT